MPYLLTLQAAYADGDSGRVARGLADLDRLRDRLRVLPQQLSLDAVFQEAWLRAAIGDTARARSALDAALATLPLQQAYFESLQGPISVVHAMALRARLALRQGDHATAVRWAGPVLELWAEADPDLMPRLADLRPLVR